MFAVPSFFGYNTTFVSTPVATAATGVGETSFTANWNAFSGASYYLLDVSLSSSFSSFVLQDTVTTATSYVVTGLTASTTYYYRIRAAINVDSDVAGFVSRVYTAGGTLSYTEVTATETLVADLKGYGIWTAMKAVYPMVGASAAACAQNLKSSSFTGTFTSGWTFASTGVTPNGTSAYMDSALVPSSQLTANSTHISYYSRTNTTTNNGLELGVWDTGYNNGLELATYRNSIFITDKTYSFLNSTSGRISAGSQNSQAFFIASRTASNNAFVKRNNTTIGTLTTTTTTALSSNNIYLGGSNDFGTPASYSTKECAFSSIGDGLTDTQASNFYTAVQTFNQTLNRQVGPQIVSDADAQAYINRVYTAGGTLTNTEANAVNQLVIDMKAAGIWTAMKAVYPMVGASAAACAQNLVSSSFTGTFTSGWTFASTGVTPNGTSAYMNTGYNANTQGSLNSAHLSCYVRTNLQGNGQIGCYDSGTSLYHIFARYTDNQAYFAINATESGVSNTNSQGFWVGSRITSTVQKLYLNNSAIINATLTSVAKPNRNVFVGASNGPTIIYSPTQCAFSSIGDGLTDTQASNFYTAVQAFQTTLSRQV